MTDLERARAVFMKTPFAAQLTGCGIEDVGPGYARCSLALEPRHMNSLGQPMGGAIFTLADFAFAVASNNVHRPTVGQQISINFLSGTRGARLIARARCRKDGRTTCVYNVDVVDDQGRDIAQFTGTGHKLQN